MSICIVAIFKNEEHILKEWIEHYLKQGINKFFMIDNGSNDNYLEILQPYINNNIVELVIDNTKHNQSNLYNMYFNEKCRTYDWVIICDLDEFIYARKQFKTIKDYLNTLDDSISQVFIPWKFFGSNGYNTLDKKQPSSVTKTFKKRCNYDKVNPDSFGIKYKENNAYINCKSITRTKNLQYFAIHHSYTDNNNYITSENCNNNIVDNTDYALCKISEKILENSYLHINHYIVQSFEFFMRIKSTRGAADYIGFENIRDENYFYKADSENNDVEDLELYNLIL
jgi:hypothetical protein